MNNGKGKRGPKVKYKKSLFANYNIPEEQQKAQDLLDKLYEETHKYVLIPGASNPIPGKRFTVSLDANPEDSYVVPNGLTLPRSLERDVIIDAPGTQMYNKQLAIEQAIYQQQLAEYEKKKDVILDQIKEKAKQMNHSHWETDYAKTAAEIRHLADVAGKMPAPPAMPTIYLTSADADDKKRSRVVVGYDKNKVLATPETSDEILNKVAALQNTYRGATRSETYRSPGYQAKLKLGRVNRMIADLKKDLGVDEESEAQKQPNKQPNIDPANPDVDKNNPQKPTEIVQMERTDMPPIVFTAKPVNSSQIYEIDSGVALSEGTAPIARHLPDEDLSARPSAEPEDIDVVEDTAPPPSSADVVEVAAEAPAATMLPSELPANHPDNADQQSSINTYNALTRRRRPTVEPIAQEPIAQPTIEPSAPPTIEPTAPPSTSSSKGRKRSRKKPPQDTTSDRYNLRKKPR